MYKATKIYTEYGKHSNILGYEYRGKIYEVEYPTDNSYCCTKVTEQHKIAQSKIDEELDNPKQETSGEPIDIDKILEITGWYDD